MKNKTSIKIGFAVIAAAITIASLAGCTATGTTHVATKPAASSSAKPTPKASAAEVKAKTGHKLVATADGTFVACSVWIPNGTTETKTVYANNADCALFTVNSVYVAKLGKQIQCSSDPTTGNSAVGAIISTDETSYKCVDTIPTADSGK